MNTGLVKISPSHKDFSFLHSFGALDFDTKGLPKTFSIYDGRPIPDQDAIDNRFSPALAPMPNGCTGETGAFESGIQDGKLYDPSDLYQNTPPGGFGGRDIRDMLQTLINRGVKASDATMSAKRTAYFNCYGAGSIDDFDAARIALYINQSEKRGVYIGSWWYPEFKNPYLGYLPTPSFNTSQAGLHNYLATGFDSTNSNDYLELISWQGQNYGSNGLVYMSREIYNALMAQPWTGAFTITKTQGIGPIPIGAQAYIDHLVYYLRHLFHA